MWAQLIRMRLKPGCDTTAVIEELKAAEQPGSGLIRSFATARSIMTDIFEGTPEFTDLEVIEEGTGA